MRRRHGRWPASLLLVRHGQSAGNVARDAAEAAGAAWIDIGERDMDVPLSEQGERQAAAVGQWLRRLGRERPTVAVASPYLRARQTACIALEAAGLDLPLLLDERLREREFGVFDRLTHRGMQDRFPAEAEARARIGKFYYRPPGGESWCDVALRVRSFLDSVTREHAGERVFVAAHEVVILMFRYVLERLSEREVLDAGHRQHLANCSVTCFVYDRRIRPHGGMRLQAFNEPLALEEAGEPVTKEPGASARIAP